MPSPDLAKLKAALTKPGNSWNVEWEPKEFENADGGFLEEAMQDICTVLNAAADLIAEIERLRGEVAAAKKLGAVEELERMAREDCTIVMPSDLPHVIDTHLEARAAELRKELA